MALKPLDEFAQIYLQGDGEPGQVGQGDIPFTPLGLSDVAPIHPGLLGQHPLTEAEFLPSRSYPLTQGHRDGLTASGAGPWVGTGHDRLSPRNCTPPSRNYEPSLVASGGPWIRGRGGHMVELARCQNGHALQTGDAYCPTCGTPVGGDGHLGAATPDDSGREQDRLLRLGTSRKRLLIGVGIAGVVLAVVLPLTLMGSGTRAATSTEATVSPTSNPGPSPTAQQCASEVVAIVLPAFAYATPQYGEQVVNGLGADRTTASLVAGGIITVQGMLSQGTTVIRPGTAALATLLDELSAVCQTNIYNGQLNMDNLGSVYQQWEQLMHTPGPSSTPCGSYPYPPCPTSDSLPWNQNG